MSEENNFYEVVAWLDIFGPWVRGHLDTTTNQRRQIYGAAHAPHFG